jgi:uncharacterized membrane protein
MGKLFRYLFVGALALIPLVVVVQLVFWVKSLGLDFFDYLSGITNNVSITYLIIVTTILILILIGLSIEKAGKNYIINLLDTTLEKVPAIGTIYSIVRKITALFKPNTQDEKKEVVLVEYPKNDVWVPAYILSKHEDVFVLFAPTSPNPTSGYTIIVHKDKIVRTSLTVAEASQFIISMGADFIKKEEISKIIQEKTKENKQIAD